VIDQYSGIDIVVKKRVKLPHSRTLNKTMNSPPLTILATFNKENIKSTKQNM